MPFPEIVLRDAAPPAAGLSSRADVAMFAGLVARRPGPVPSALAATLAAAGFTGSGPFRRRGQFRLRPPDDDALLDVPVPVDSFDAFDALFAWDERPVQDSDPRRIPTALGLAVRRFFALGGQRAIILRTGDPLPLLADAAQRARILSHGDAPPAAAPPARVPLLPGFRGLGTPVEATDPNTWHGAAHALGVDEAAMLLLPDLPELLAGPPLPLPEPGAPPAAPETFRPCAPAATGFEPARQPLGLDRAAPRLDRAGYAAWADALRFTLDLLAPSRSVAQRRDVMLVASLPLPARAAGAVPHGTEAWPLALLDDTAVPGGRLLARTRLGSARLQLAWPWIETADSLALPEAVEAPDGALAGVLAASALRAGAFRSAAGTRVAGISRTLPVLATGSLRRSLPGSAADWLGDRLCLIGAGPRGFALLSDATMAEEPAWRAGGVSRLSGIVLRAARQLGQQRLFDAAGPALWASLREELEGFMAQLREAGALSGATPAEAFVVRCDRGTMSQADIDAGRVIATVIFTAAQPIQRISVMLALAAGGLATARAA